LEIDPILKPSIGSIFDPIPNKYQSGDWIGYIFGSSPDAWVFLSPRDYKPTIRVQHNASHIQWMLLAGPKPDGIWYIRLGDQMPSTMPGGVHDVTNAIV
jgi:hypothetical protein